MHRAAPDHLPVARLSVARRAGVGGRAAVRAARGARAAVARAGAGIELPTNVAREDLTGREPGQHAHRDRIRVRVGRRITRRTQRAGRDRLIAEPGALVGGLADVGLDVLPLELARGLLPDGTLVVEEPARRRRV